MNDQILTEERIERMRTNVMGQIGQRRKKVAAIGVLAAVGTVVALGALITGVAPLFYTGQADMAGAPAVYPGLVDEYSGDDAADAAETSSTSDAMVRTNYDANEIVTGWTSLTVGKPREVASKVRAEVTRLGGRIDHESIESFNEESVTLTARVPTAELEEFTTFLNGLGKVTESSINREQVGEEVRDLEARISALEVSTERLRSIMRNAKTTKDLLAAESKLAARQAELDSLKGSRKQLADQTAKATITVQLTGKSAAATVNPGGFKGGLINGWNALVTTFDNSLAAAGFLLPWVIPAALVVLLVRFVWRRRTRTEL